MSLTTNLVSYWKLDEASGDAIDAHGSNQLTENNAPGSVTGKIVNARSFDPSSGNYFSKADNADLSTGDIDFTFNAWVYFNTLNTYQVVFSKWGSTLEYILYVWSDGVVHWQVSSNGSASDDLTLGGISSGTWYMITCWHDAANNIRGITINAGTPTTASYSSGVHNGGEQFAIGYNTGDSSGPTFGYNIPNGNIDEVGFWKRVLTSQDRTDLYNGGAGLAYPLSTGVIGDASITIGAATSSASGALDIQAVTSPIIATVASSAAGTIDIAGASSPTLDAISSSIAGTVDIAGSASPTIDSVTSSAAGALYLAATATPTVDAVTSSAAGALDIQGSLSSTTDAVTVSATGAVDIVAELGATIDVITLAATDSLDIVSNVGLTLDPIALGADGSSTSAIIGECSPTIAEITGSAAGTVDLAGSLTVTLNAVTSTIAGTIDIAGIAGPTIAAVTSSAACTLDLASSVNTAVSPITCTSNGSILLAGVVGATIGACVIDASGTSASGTMAFRHGLCPALLAPNSLSSFSLGA